MNFLLVLLAAVIEFTVASAHGLRSRDWSRDWAGWLETQLARQRWWDGPWGAALVLAVPVVLVALAFAVLGEVSAVLRHVVALGVLLLMLGPEDLNAELDAYKRRLLIAGEDDGSDADGFRALGAVPDLGEPTGDPALEAQRRDLAAVALAADCAWYQPLFWFFVLGPVGAVLYRLCANVRGSSLSPGNAAVVAEVRQAMEWLPARLTALAMGLAGSLVPVIDCVRAHGIVRWSDTDALVARSALAAIDQGRVQHVISTDPRVYRLNLVHALMKRSLNVWLVFLAIAALLW